MLDGSRASADSLELEKGVADQRERKCVSAGLPETATDSTCIQGAFCRETCEPYLTWTGLPNFLAARNSASTHPQPELGSIDPYR